MPKSAVKRDVRPESSSEKILLNDIGGATFAQIGTAAIAIPVALASKFTDFSVCLDPVVQSPLGPVLAVVICAVLSLLDLVVFTGRNKSRWFSASF